MYLVTKFNTIVYEGDDLSEFLYQDFEIKIDSGKIYIRPKNFNSYMHKDFEKMNIGYSKEYTKEEIINDFIKITLTSYIKKYDYKIYKVNT